MVTKADVYRAKAAECRARAQRAELPKEQSAWNRLAEDWEDFAKSMDEVAKHWLS
jgi:hypothetical protein